MKVIETKIIEESENEFGQYPFFNEEFQDQMDGMRDILSEAEDDDDKTDWITLNGCNKITCWQFPQKETKCQLKSCSLECSSRSAAITHYKQTHASEAILCYICDEPIQAKTPDDFKKHYDTTHPGIEVPFIFNSIATNSEEQTDPIQENVMDSSIGNDLIRLRGCGKVTCWLFPQDQRICPIENCQMNFEERSSAIRHYREEHAEHSIFCYVCETPILALQPHDFDQHFREMHPDMQSSICFDEETVAKPEKVRKLMENSKTPTEKWSLKLKRQSTENITDVQQLHDDIIILNGGGHVTHWQLPQTDWSRCPILSCRKEFILRSHAMLHFKKMHSQNSTFCPECKKPIVVKDSNTFIEHYYKLHPKSALPFDFDVTVGQKMREEPKDDLIQLSGCGQTSYWQMPTTKAKWKICKMPKCLVKFETRSEAIAHFRQNHACNTVLCVTCDKPIKTMRPVDFLRHHRTLHPHLEMPYNLKTKEERLNNIEEKIDIAAEGDLIRLFTFGKTTYWRFPANSTQCPSCRKVFSNRLAAIRHYKKEHANGSMLCRLCNKPLRITDHSMLRRHFLRIHPGIEIPSFGINSESKQKCAIPEGNVKSSEDDIIILNGCGYQTQWRFPNATMCPMRKCSETFSTRRATMSHFEKTHAMRAILCYICDMPIKTPKRHAFVQHYLRKHPKTPLPKAFEEHFNSKTLNESKIIEDGNSQKQLKTKIPKSTKSSQKSLKPKEVNRVGKTKTKNTDDWIILSGLNRIRKWRFPDVLKCPARNCHFMFKTRTATIIHYKKKHAPFYTLCSFCEKPICVTNPGYMMRHYRRVHFKELQNKSPIKSNDIELPNQIVASNSKLNECSSQENFRAMSQVNEKSPETQDDCGVETETHDNDKGSESVDVTKEPNDIDIDSEESLLEPISEASSSYDESEIEDDMVQLIRKRKQLKRSRTEFRLVEYSDTSTADSSGDDHEEQTLLDDQDNHDVEDSNLPQDIDQLMESCDGITDFYVSNFDDQIEDSSFGPKIVSVESIDSEEFNQMIPNIQEEIEMTEQRRYSF